MKKILFVGEHPISTSGNGGMMLSVLSDMDQSKYEATVFALESTPVDPSQLVSKPFPFSIISAYQAGDMHGCEKLEIILTRGEIDALVMVGIDLWHYHNLNERIKKLTVHKKIPWISIFPYDLPVVRDDWVNWIKMIDYPCVYSKYGEELLKDAVSNIRYFRPPLRAPDVWRKLTDKDRWDSRRALFPTVSDDHLIFGFIGANQVRKDPQKAIKAFSIARQVVPNITLYLHSNLLGVYNLKQFCSDCGLKENQVIVRREGNWNTLEGLVRVYNSMDCLLNSSLQEGLSWTLVEAMLCGTPFIATKNTAQTELIEGAGYGVDCNEMAYMPLIGSEGESWFEAEACSAMDLANAIIDVAQSETLRKKMSKDGLVKGKEWLEGISSINDVLEEALKVPQPSKVKKKNRVLFAQHSAAGDVLMTTRCFKALKERHGGIPLDFMTQDQYMDIIKGNPYVDEIIPWDEARALEYDFYYNPHSERILPGHWGRNANSILADFYWKILLLDKPDDFFIEQVKPKFMEAMPEAIEAIREEIGDMPVHKIGFAKPICILHTTGGDSHFRSYRFMKDVHNALEDDYFTIQLGGVDDYPAWANMDLRGKLTFREAAWVMSKATIAVTVDSFISHLAGALGIPQVALYGSGNSAVCQPKQVGGKLITLSPDYIVNCPGLGPCSASIRDCPVPCTGRHTPESILEAINQIESEWRVDHETISSSK